MKRLSAITMSAGLMLLACLAFAGPPLDPKAADQKFKESYSLGYEFGADLKAKKVDVDADVLISAIQDALHEKKPSLSREDIRGTLDQLRKKVAVARALRFREDAEKNFEKSEAFLEANKSKEGVKALPSGLQYRILREGEGPSPKASDVVKVSYQGTLTDGTGFDSAHSDSNPVITRVDNLIKGLAEALQLMKAGSKWQLFVPPWLGYGERGFRNVLPNSVIIYDIELLSIGDSVVSEISSSRAAEGSSSSAPSSEKGGTRPPDSRGE